MNAVRSSMKLVVPGVLGLFIACSAYLSPSPAVAQTVNLGPGESFSTSADGKSVICGFIKGNWVPGKFQRGSNIKFLTHKKEIQTLKKQQKTADTLKYNKLQKKINKLKSAQSRGKPACQRGPSGGGGSGGGGNNGGGGSGGGGNNGGGGATGNFDANGNVTAAGKAVFGIPSGLSANVNTGSSIHRSRCSGCHGENINRTFSQYRVLTSLPPMLFSSSNLSDSDLAHITAYLNRYRIQ